MYLFDSANLCGMKPNSSAEKLWSSAADAPSSNFILEKYLRSLEEITTPNIVTYIIQNIYVIIKGFDKLQKVDF